MSNFMYIVLAVLALLFMITVHELGHYVAGKIFNFKINEFAIGFGPALFKRTSKKTGEVFSIRAIPLGGFCAFEGEDEEGESPQSFNKQKPWQRIIVLFSGAFMNFVSALLIAIIVFTAAGALVPKVGSILPDQDGQSPQQMQLQEGDYLLSVEGEMLYFPFTSGLSQALAQKQPGETVNLQIARDGKRLNIAVTVRDYAYYDQDGELVRDDQNQIVTQTGMGITHRLETFGYGFFEAIGQAVTYTFKLAGLLLEVLGQLFTGNIALNQVGGPISTVTETAQVGQILGFNAFLTIVMFIGVNLAVVNLLPIPALDGARIVFTAIEWVRGKPVKRSVEGMIHFVGLVLLFGFVIVVDVMHLIG